MNSKKQAYKEFATIVADLIKSREQGNWPKSAEAFCVSVEAKLDDYSFEYDNSNLSYGENQPAYDLFYEAVARKIDSINVAGKKDIEKKAIYDRTYDDIIELFDFFNLGSLLEGNDNEKSGPTR